MAVKAKLLSFILVAQTFKRLTSCARSRDGVTFIRKLFAFLSHNFLRHCCAVACKARSRRISGERFSHITFPDRGLCVFAASSSSSEQTNTLIFSHNFSSGWLNPPEQQRNFSHITFRNAVENAVCAALAHKKRGKYQPGKVM